MAPICRHWFVKGRVQGVWFRASTKKEADALGLTGWVKNLSDGSVEVLACGEKEKVQQLHDWLAHGPALAQVTEIVFEELPLQAHAKFDVL